MKLIEPPAAAIISKGVGRGKVGPRFPRTEEGDALPGRCLLILWLDAGSRAPSSMFPIRHHAEVLTAFGADCTIGSPTFITRGREMGETSGAGAGQRADAAIPRADQ